MDEKKEERDRETELAKEKVEGNGVDGMEEKQQLSKFEREEKKRVREGERERERES